MKGRFFGVRIAGTVCFFALAPSLAWSYIDPGNGAYMVQALFTLAGAALFYIRHPLRFFRALRQWVFGARSTGTSTEVRESAEIETRLESVPGENVTSRGD